MYKIVDVSKNNGAMTATTLKDNVDGVIIRIGYRGYGKAGNLVTDTMFDNYAKACVNAKIPQIAFYFFPTSINEQEAIEEAEYAYKLASKYVSNPLIFADSEIADTKNKNGRSDKLSKAVRTKLLITFCDKIIALGGRSGIYASDSWFKNQLDLPQITKYPLWVAKYSSVAPIYVKDYVGWQYTSKAKVDGLAKIENDLSYFYKSLNDIGKIKEVNPYTVPTRVLKKKFPMMYGDDVKWVQYNVGVKADGWFGKDTEQAVKEYQLIHKLTVDGIVGMNTRAEMLGTWK